MAEEELQQQQEEEEQNEEGQEEKEADNAMRSVSSTMVDEMGYDEENGEIAIVFVNGHEETYAASPDMWEELKQAGSIGVWMHENLLSN